MEFGSKVSQKLQQLAKKKGPDEQDFLKLENDVKEFAVCLMDPLKSDDRKRNAFSAWIDGVVDKAIETGQKKVKGLRFDKFDN